MDILVWDGSAESLDRNSQDVENIAGILQDVRREEGAHDVFVWRCAHIKSALLRETMF